MTDVAGRGVQVEGPTGAFAPMRFPQYRLLWISGGIVFLAVNAQTVARAWLAKELTGTNAGLGGVMLGFGLPMLVATPWGGLAADRLSKRLVLVAATALLMLSSAWIGIAVALDVIEYWMLIATAGLQAVAFGFFGPARMAFIAELVDRPMLPRAVALGQMSAESTRVFGPALAGVLIGVAAWGTEAVFLVAAVLTAIAALNLCRMPPGRPAPGRPGRSPFRELADGLRYARREPGLGLLVATSLGVVVIGFPYMTFLPTLADDVFDVGSGGYGLMSAVTSLGAVAAAVALARRPPAHPWRSLGTAGLCFAGGIVALGLAPTFAVALLTLPVVGAAGLMFQATNQSLLLSLSSFEYHGRLQSLVMLGFSGFGIVALPLGLLADAIGVQLTLVLMGSAVAVIMGAFALRQPRHRHRTAVMLEL